MRLWQHPLARLFTALCAVWLILNLPLLLGLRVLPGDAMDEFYPLVYFNVHSLRAGLAPWWNPYIFSGYPQIADPQAMLFSPLFMAWMLLRAEPGTSWFVWGALLHVLLGGMAMAALLRRLQASPFGALIGATVFMAGGVAASRIQHVPLLLSYACAPLVLLALRHFMDAPRWRRGLLLGLALAGMLAQPVQVTYLLSLMLAAYGLALTVRRWPDYDASQRSDYLTGVLLALALGASVALPQMLLSWAFVTVSNRPSLALSAAAEHALDPRVLLSLLDPNALHALRGRFDGPAGDIEGFLYIGALPMLMILLASGRAWRVTRQRRQLIFFGIAAAAATIYMIGPYTPIYAWLYRWLPGVQQFRRPSDAAYLLNIALAMAAGLGASHIDLTSKRRNTLLLGAATLWLALASLHMEDAQHAWEWPTAAAAAVAGVALWQVRRSDHARLTACWLLIVLLADYRCFNLDGKFNQWHDNEAHFLRDPASGFLAAQLASTPPGSLEPRIESIDAGVQWRNDVILRELPATHGYGPLRWALYDRWYGADVYGRGDSGRPYSKFNPDPDSVMNALLGVKYLVRQSSAGESSAGESPQRIYRGGGTDIWLARHAYARVLTPSHARLMPPGEPPPLSAFNATDFDDIVWLTPRNIADRDADLALMGRCNGRATLVSANEAPTHTELRTRAGTAGWLVLADQDFPGWSASVDGAMLPIHRANGLFRAVCVPAGEHTVRFDFHPWQMFSAVWQDAAAWR